MSVPGSGRGAGNTASVVDVSLVIGVVRGFYLDRGVGDTELLQAVVRDVEDIAAGLDPVRVDDEVAGGDELAAVHRPHVEIVRGLHTGDLLQCSADLVEVDVSGDPFHQHPGGVKEEAHGPGQDDRRDDDGSDGVGQDEAGRPNDEARDDHGDGAEHVGKDVEVGTAHVHAVVLAADEQECGSAVGDETDDRDDQHHRRVDVPVPAEPLDRLDHDPDGDRPDGERIDGRRDDLDTAVSEGGGGGGRPPADEDRHQGDDQTRRIGEHVGGVGEQRQGAGQQTEDDLREEDRGGQDDDTDQRFEGFRCVGVRVPAMTVIMPVVVLPVPVVVLPVPVLVVLVVVLVVFPGSRGLALVMNTSSADPLLKPY